MRWLNRLAGVPFLRKILTNRFAASPKPLQLFGIKFTNPVGLAAGFDKNAVYLPELSMLGFGHVEIGTVTPRPQDGNEKPRLFRLPEDKALINRMGFNNDGVDTVAERLKNFRTQYPSTSLIIGGNIGKNKDTPNEYAYMDYNKCFRSLHPWVDYFVVNVSSPNTPGLRELQETNSLRQLLSHLQGINQSMPTKRPLLLKIAPDLSTDQLKEIVALAVAIQLDGLVVANTSLDRTTLSDAGKIRAAEAGNGGLSGLPVGPHCTRMIASIAQQTGGKLPIVASGGVFTTEHAKEKLAAGASLVQVWTGFVYEGPAIVKNICKGL